MKTQIRNETKKKILHLFPISIEQAKESLGYSFISNLQELSIILNLSCLVLARDLNLHFLLFKIDEKVNKNTGEINVNSTLFTFGFSDGQNSYYLLDREIKTFLYAHLNSHVFTFELSNGFTYNESHLSFYDLQDTKLNILSMCDFLNVEDKEAKARLKSIVNIDEKLSSRIRTPIEKQIQTLF